MADSVQVKARVASLTAAARSDPSWGRGGSRTGGKPFFSLFPLTAICSSLQPQLELKGIVSGNLGLDRLDKTAAWAVSSFWPRPVESSVAPSPRGSSVQPPWPVKCLSIDPLTASLDSQATAAAERSRALQGEGIKLTRRQGTAHKRRLPGTRCKVTVAGAVTACGFGWFFSFQLAPSSESFRLWPSSPAHQPALVGDRAGRQQREGIIVWPTKTNSRSLLLGAPLPPELHRLQAVGFMLQSLLPASPSFPSSLALPCSVSFPV